MSAFRFKQFSVSHDKCAMKVGTDGVLIGAWANHHHPSTILDIGTGSGLISFMMAQRFHDAKIKGIDIDEEAILQARENKATNPWKERIVFQHQSLSELSPSSSFDLIVSNPPFYDGTNTSGNIRRDLARQNNSLPPSLLFKHVASILQTAGSFCCILPSNTAMLYEQEAHDVGLFNHKELKVKGNKSAPIKRVLIQFGFEEKEKITEELVIETEKRHVYTSQYLSLVKDFYLFA